MRVFEYAKCKGKDPETFTPSEKETKKERTAKRICKGCPIRKECLEFALYTDSIGIWAGTNYSERQLMMLMMPELRPATLAESSHNGNSLLSDESKTPSSHHIGNIPTLPESLLSSEFPTEPYPLMAEAPDNLLL